MITSDEAEERAHALVKQFVKDAGCNDMRDVANVLAKLAAVTGLSMVEAIGRREALLRMSAATTAVHNGADRPSIIAQYKVH